MSLKVNRKTFGLPEAIPNALLISSPGPGFSGFPARAESTPTGACSAPAGVGAASVPARSSIIRRIRQAMLASLMVAAYGISGPSSLITARQ
ncbi:hypothetical protein ACQP1W_18770 [Spirillospora sp. CA-255316]